MNKNSIEVTALPNDRVWFIRWETDYSKKHICKECKHPKRGTRPQKLMVRKGIVEKILIGMGSQIDYYVMPLMFSCWACSCPACTHEFTC